MPETFQSKNEPTERRPWGAFWVLEEDVAHKVKRLVVKPNARLSLQLHHQREEHWLVISGEALVTVGEKTWLVKKGESVFVPKGMKHRIANAGTVETVIVEVQLGTYFGEDDEVRLQDDYNRESPLKE